MLLHASFLYSLNTGKIMTLFPFFLDTKKGKDGIIQMEGLLEGLIAGNEFNF
jgi:hypothetical protein